MIHIFLTIFKIIAIGLLAILLLLLALIMLILLIPIKYRANAVKIDDINGYVKAHWLLKFIYISYYYKDSKSRTRIRILGIPIYDSDRKKKSKKKSKIKNKKSNNITKNNDIEQIGIVKDIDKEIDDMIKKDKETIVDDKGNLDTNDTIVHENFFCKISNFIKNIILGIKNFFKGLLNIKGNITNIKNFINDEENKLGLKELLKALKKLLVHIKPKKLNCNIAFGTNDPCTTGIVLGVFSMFYGIYKDNIKVVPNFEQAILEGDISIKGRIRVITILIICIKLLLNEHMKNLIKSYKNFKEE